MRRVKPQAPKMLRWLNEYGAAGVWRKARIPGVHAVVLRGPAGLILAPDKDRALMTRRALNEAGLSDRAIIMVRGWEDLPSLSFPHDLGMRCLAAYTRELAQQGRLSSDE